MNLVKKRLRLKIKINADPVRIYDAVTSPLKLGIWMCNKAEVNLKLRGTIRLWGENCVAVTFPEKEIKGTILELEPNRVMRFTWPISGKPSEVLFQIDDKGRSCDFLVTHDKIAEGSFMMDHWITALYNLQSLLHYQRPAYRLDYTHIDSGTIRRELFIETLPSVVFKALTDQRDLRGWFAKEMESEPHIGGKYITGWKGKDGVDNDPREIKELVENKKLVYDWYYNSDAGAGSLVSWELLRIGDRTRVNLKHSGFDPKRQNKDYMQGWHAYLLTLKDFCESGGQLSYYVIEGDWSV